MNDILKHGNKNNSISILVAHDFLISILYCLLVYAWNLGFFQNNSQQGYGLYRAVMMERDGPVQAQVMHT